MADFTKHFVVVGGSLAGLFTGIMLTRLGHHVTILERTPAEALADQGAGIIVHSIIPPVIEATVKLIGSISPIVEFLEEYDRTHTIAYALGKRGIQYLERDGTVLNTVVPAGLKELGSTNWDLLYNVLRANFDGRYATGYVEAAAREEGDGKAVYLSGVRLTNIQDLGDGGVKVEYESSNGSSSSLIADFMVGADGPSSIVRKLLLPQVERTYAGYVAWRGTVKEPLVSEETRTLLRSKILTVFHRRGHQILVYKIPGVNGSVAPGELLENLVWYANIDDKELKDILIDSEGNPHTFSLGVGHISPEVKAKQRETAAVILPAHMAELWQKVESPFIQAITDSLATKCVFLDGKVILVGDVVAGLRPHTTAGTNQAALHVLLLKKGFDKGTAMSVVEWEQKILEWSTIAHAVGIKLGNLSQFDDHPMVEKDEGLKI